MERSSNDNVCCGPGVCRGAPQTQQEACLLWLAGRSRQHCHDCCRMWLAGNSNSWIDLPIVKCASREFTNKKHQAVTICIGLLNAIALFIQHLTPITVVHSCTGKEIPTAVSPQDASATGRATVNVLSPLVNRIALENEPEQHC